jgi:hypothetical protein
MDYMIYISEFGGDEYIIDQRFPKFKMAQAELRRRGFNKTDDKRVYEDEKSGTYAQICNTEQREPIRIEIEGKQYTLREASKLTGIHYNTLYLRHRKGMTGDKLLSKEKLRGPNTGYRVKYKGIEYESYSAAARSLGTYVENIRRRVEKGEIELLGETNE